MSARQVARVGLVLAGIAAVAGAVLHIAILFGGPDWYAEPLSGT